MDIEIIIEDIKMEKKLLALSLLMGAAVSAPAFAVDWNGDTTTATAVVKVTQQNSVAVDVNGEAELSGDIKAGTKLFALTLKGDSSTPSVIILAGLNNTIRSDGSLINNVQGSDGNTRNGSIVAKLEGTGSGNYELIADTEYLPEGAYLNTYGTNMFKLTGSPVNDYAITATTTRDIPSNELISGLYEYSFAANSYTE